jgi:FlaG/FlaF family flagellin (archaellin)
MTCINNKDEAVSPVVGVMLMLVVTIIIAAVVSAFAGGLAGDTQATPQATLMAKEIVVKEAYDASTVNNMAPHPVSDKAADIYLIFEHMGGDGINLNSIEVHLSSLKYPHEKTIVSNAKTPNTDAAVVGDKTNITSSFSDSWTQYLEGYPDGEMLISPGSQFALHADYGQWTTTYYSAGNLDRKAIGWKPDDALNAFTVEAGDYLTYDIIDKQSQRSIASGQILVRDFEVATS